MSTFTSAVAVLITGTAMIGGSGVVNHIGQEQACRYEATNWSQGILNKRQLNDQLYTTYYAERLAKLNASCGGSLPAYVELNGVPTRILDMARSDEMVSKAQLALDADNGS